MRLLRQMLAITCFAVLIGLSFSTSAANLIAFIASDTYDEYIGDSVSIDFNNIRQEMKNVSQNTGLTLKEILIRGKANNTQNFLQTLSSFTAGPDDVIVFFYAGHGYRMPSKGDIPWPNLVFTQEKNERHKGIQYEYVIYQLMEKNPRLLITIADVCNDIKTEKDAPPVVTRSAIAYPNLAKIRENYKQLYLEEAGMINITSAKIGETAAGDEDDGGLFTSAFLASMKFETSNASPANWRTLIERASNKVTQASIIWAKKHGKSLDRAEKDGEIQHPYYEINTGTIQHSN